jgi:hypothetical protein
MVSRNFGTLFLVSVAEPQHLYAAPPLAPGENFHTAPAAPAPSLLYSRSKFLKGINLT